MSEEIVRILTVQTGNSTQTINNLKQAIKSLRQELSKAQVGSKQYNETLRELTQVQRQYSLINKDISERSKAQEVNLQTMAQLGQNLAKTYSSINAVIGLLGDNNEDLNKSMLKVQRTIQLIQGLSGIGGLIKQIPQLLNGFKSWLSSFDPLERKVVNIAKGINAIDGKKLNQIAGLQGGSIKIGDVSAKATAGGLQGGTAAIAKENEAFKEQARTVAALNDRLAVNKERQLDLKAALDRTSRSIVEVSEGFNKANADYENALKRYTAANDAYIQSSGKLRVTEEQLGTSIDNLKDGYGRIAFKMEEVNGKYEKRRIANSEERKQLQALSDEVDRTKAKRDAAAESLKYYTSLKERDTKRSKELAEEEKALRKEIEMTTTAAGKAWTTVKSIFSTALFSVAVGLVIAGISALWKLITNIQTAAKEQKEFNKAIREGTAQGASKAIVVLKELSIGYQKVGDSAEAKKKFLEEYNDKIKETGIAVNDVNTADDVFIKNTSKYIDALMKRAKAQATENYAIKKYEEFLIERGKIEEKIANPTLTTDQSNSVAGVVGSGYVTKETLDEQARLRDQLLADNKKKSEEALEEADKQMDAKLTKWFTDIANLQSEYAGVFNISDNKDQKDPKEPKENPFDIEAAILKTYLEDVERYQDSLKSAKDKEIEETEAFYDRLIVNAAYFGQDYQQYVEAREKAVADIEKKYADEELENQKKQAEDRLALLDAQINRIRSRYDTSNIQKVREQTFQTNYRQPVTTTALGLGPSWLNTYQSGQNVKDEYNAQVTYNNKILELTRLRIEQENALLNQQLEVEGITADRRMEIERTLAENRIALSDAVLDNEEANLQAYKKMQEARQQALNATLSVASNVMGGMASLMKAESENTKKSDKERANSFKAYKALSISQAITDTFKAANESYSAMASIPYVGPALGAAAAIAAIIAGIANVRRIQNEEMSTSSSSSSVAVTAPVMQTNPIEYQRQLLGDQELDQLNQPMKCYVLESEITSTQNKVKVSESNSSF